LRKLCWQEEPPKISQPPRYLQQQVTTSKWYSSYNRQRLKASPWVVIVNNISQSKFSLSSSKEPHNRPAITLRDPRLTKLRIPIMDRVLRVRVRRDRRFLSVTHRQLQSKVTKRELII
jgi:hypothetical protein